MALDRYRTWRQTVGPDRLDAGARVWLVKGTGTDELYVMEANPATGAIPVDFSPVQGLGDPAPASRVASMIGGYDDVAAGYAIFHVSEHGNMPVAGLIPEDWRGLTVAYPSATQETFEYFRDAAKTQSICTITVDYTDATKQNLSSVTRA